MIMELETCDRRKDINKKVKELKMYSDFAYFGEIKGKLILVKEKLNLKAFINFDELNKGITFFSNIKDNKQKYNESDFDKNTLQKIKELNEEKRKLLFNKYFEENPTKNANDLKQIKKIYTIKHRIKEHI